MEYENSGYIVNGQCIPSQKWDFTQRVLTLCGYIVNGQCIPSQKWDFIQQVLTLIHTEFVKEF
jgi:hypothetical protein